MVWGDTVQEVIDKAPHLFTDEALKWRKASDIILSLTFIEGDIYDNKELLRQDPGYIAKLMAQDEQTRSQLLDWNRHLKIDDNSLGNYAAIGDIFSNYLNPEEWDKKAITVDVARFGRDLTVSGVRLGRHCARIDIKTKSKTTETFGMIENQRREYGIGKSEVNVDQDGVGGGVVDEWDGYIGFSWWRPALPDPEELKRDNKAKPENYENLKTQCFYRLFERRVNKRKISIDPDNIRVDGVQTTTIEIWNKIFDVKELIIKDLRAIKRVWLDKDGKLKINDKAAQKLILGWRSPDFADMIMMREFVELTQEPELDIFFI